MHRLLLPLGKYALAAVLLVWVIHSNWAPPAPRALSQLAASTCGLVAAPGSGPLLAVTSAFPSRAQGHGLGYVWQRHVHQRQPLRSGYLLTALFTYTLGLLLTLWRWHVLVRALDLELSLRDALRYGFLGVFFNTFLPGAVGGDIVKAAALARTQRRRTAAVASVLMDRLLGLWALVWFVAFLGGAFWLAGWLDGLVANRIVSLALLLVTFSSAVWLLVGLLPEARAQAFANWLSQLPILRHSAGEFWRAIWMYRRRQKSVLFGMLLTVVAQVGFVLSFWYGTLALWAPHLGAIPSWSQHFLLVPIGAVLQALVPTPGGAGGGEWGFGALYLLFHAAEANGVLGSLVQRLLSWVLGLAGYFVYLLAAPASLPTNETTTLALPAGSPPVLAG